MRFSFNLANAPKNLLPQVKQNLREKVPLLTVKELRRIKEPLVKVLKIELIEEGRPKALRIYDEIIRNDKKHKKFFQNKKNENFLLEIFEFLKTIDEKTWEEEVEALVNFAFVIFVKNEEIDWLIESLLIQATERITEYHLEGKKVDAITKFVHGLSLYHRLHWFRAALLHFEYAFKLAHHNDKWIFNNKKLSNSIALELSKCAVKLSQEIRKNKKEIENALAFSKRALLVLRYDLELENFEFEFEAEYEYASCWVDYDDYESALSHFEHAAALAEKCSMKEKYCECLLEIVNCYRNLENFEKQKNYLNYAEKYEAENSLTFYSGKIAVEMMKLFMDIYDNESAEKYLNEAIDFYKQINKNDEIVKTEEIYANYHGKLKFNKIVDAVLKSDKTQPNKNHDLTKLINWMDYKSSEIFKSKSREDFNLDEFIETFYNPDEIVKIDSKNEE
ncbi:hypothetical protein PVAND_005743 [Polypedilum vanderplanki]|uniref:Tetratricopeptide repeat protein n=1 Tax=Polypedilum vanderplanki TaxID=319348 RepID=A0A9J6C1Y4_POLVA|nr:hypothetical protein PVAND_005743 [Polypedilum vanderplanki]